MENLNPVRRQSILFLDSDHELVCILASFLSSQKCKVAQSRKSREALFKMRNQVFDTIIIDPSIPDERQFFSGIGEVINLKNKPNLLIMTKDLSYQLPSSMPLTIKGVLPKPFELVDFWNVINR